MHVTYFYHWGLFHPIRWGADVVASNHLSYFRERGWSVDIVTLRWPFDEPSLEKFHRHYHWARSITLLEPRAMPFTFRDTALGFEAMSRDEKVREVLGRPCDLFFTNYIFTAPLLACLPPRVRTVVETLDVVSTQMLAQETPRDADGHFLPAPLVSCRRDFLLRTEVEMYRLFDAAIMISPKEHAEVRALGADNAHFVPQWHQVAEAPPARGDDDASYDLLFVGSNHPPNTMGLRWFYQNVYIPHLWHRGVRLGVVGTVGYAFRTSDAHVSFLGRVDRSLAEIYGQARLVVAPVFEGTGLAIKLIEAMAMGMPIVASPVAARGLDPASGAFVQTDMQADPRGTAEEILRLLADPARRRALGEKAAGYAQRQFGREAFLRGMDAVVRAVGLDPHAGSAGGGAIRTAA